MKFTKNSLLCCEEELAAALGHTDCGTALIGLINLHCATLAERGYSEQAAALQAELEAVARTLQVTPDADELSAFCGRTNALLGHGKYTMNTTLNVLGGAIISIVRFISGHDSQMIAMVDLALERSANQVFALIKFARGCGASGSKVN
jgi:hypothetical protein